MASFVTKRRKRRHDFPKYAIPTNVKMEVIFGILNKQRCVWRRSEIRCQEVGGRWYYNQELDRRIPQNQYAIILHRPLELCIGKCASKGNLIKNNLRFKNNLQFILGQVLRTQLCINYVT